MLDRPVIEVSMKSTRDSNIELFETVASALDAAALGEAGYNYYALDGSLQCQMSYGELRQSARALATRLASMFPRNARVAVLGETIPAFHIVFFACQYSGHIAVPLPLPEHTGGKQHYIAQCRRMVESSGAQAVVASLSYQPLIREALEGHREIFIGTLEDLMEQPEGHTALQPFLPEEACYIQYSSGSTSFPKGVAGTQRSVTSNLNAIIGYGLRCRPGDRSVSWLPLYHDMGLVGFALAPVFSEVTVDYLAPIDFARRPLLWLELLSRNRATISFSPSFGYEICVRRMGRSPDRNFDLSQWRVAGIGGDMVRPETLEKFANMFAASNFKKSAFLPSYGLAESTLAVTFAAVDSTFEVDDVLLEERQNDVFAQPAGDEPGISSVRHFVLCGRPLPQHELCIKANDGQPAIERQVGRILIRGPSVMQTYFQDSASTSAIRDTDGWLDTGDLGYMVGGQLVVTGRNKDLILHNGRKIWPEDIEWALAKHFDRRIRRCVAFSVNGAASDDSIVTVIETPQINEKSRKDILVEAKQVIFGASGVASEIILVKAGAIPVTSSGKVQRNATKTLLLADELSQ